jgi:hypothetical protein
METCWSYNNFKITLDELCKVHTDISIVNIHSIKHLLIDVERDYNRVMNSDTSYPIILLTKNKNYYRILDGQHRVCKLLNFNRNYISAIVIPIEYSDLYYKIFN